MNYWIFSNHRAGEYEDSIWDTSRILETRRWYFRQNNPNATAVRKGDWVIARIYGVDYFAKFRCRSAFTIDTKHGSRSHKVGYIKIEQLDGFDPPLPQGLVIDEISNKNVRNKIIRVNKADFDRIELARRVYKRMGGSGMPFPGIHAINHSFTDLEKIFSVGRIDWMAALKDMKGVYLITDISNGKKYVGSAYGGEGLWSRWGCYIETGHGGNDELVKLIRRRSLDYARKNFSFSVLEAMAQGTADDVVQGRETHWKKVLLTRDRDHGYNRN